MRYLLQFDNLPTKLPMSDQARGKLQRELQELPQQVFPTIAAARAQQERIEALRALLDADLEARRSDKSR